MGIGSIATAAHVLREAGPLWVAWRVWLDASHRLGLDERRTPAAPWSARPLATWLRPGVPTSSEGLCTWRTNEGRATWIADAVPAPAQIGPGCVAEADRILAGEWPFFSGEWLPIGFPPPWHRHPLSGREWDPSLHWSAVGDASTDDIKYLWEPARFSVVFTLARAWARTGDDRYAEAIWRLIDDWIDANPPMRGAQWRCGQETSFRIFAWCFGLHTCLTSPATTPDRVARLVAAVAWQGERIEAHIGYARSQKNNHALSEAIGLLTIGTLFPELQRAAHWRAFGARVLAEELGRQVYPDGAFVQHATNYHRVMLHDVAWALAIARRNDVPLPGSVAQAFARGAEWLRLMTDPVTGLAPNFGNNDGALVLPLTDCAFGDMRPTIRLAAHLLGLPSHLPDGPWDEMTAWFAGPLPTREAPTVPTYSGSPAIAPHGGQVVLRGARTWAMLRCARFVDRPAHADQLHVDVWWRGLDIARDAGTYRYSAEPPWDHALARSAVHNTVTVDGADQMVRVSRFLWTRWAQGQVDAKGALDGASWARAHHDGYLRRGVTHHRTVVCLSDHVVVVDDLVTRTSVPLRLQWLLQPDGRVTAPGTVQLETPHGEFCITVAASLPSDATLVSGGSPDEPTRGWWSPTYGVKEPCRSLVAQVTAQGAVRFVSVFGPADDKRIVASDLGRVRLADDGRVLDLHLPVGAAPTVEPCP